jgi:uncharacterized membrane protein
MHIPEFLLKIGYAICHQFPERSFDVNGRPLPLCSRCTGIYLGMFITFTFYFLFKFIRNKKPSIPPPLFASIISIFFILLMVANAVSPLVSFSTSNIARFVTGILFGFTIPLFLIPAFNYSKKSPSQNELIVNYKEYFLLLVMVILLAVVVLLKINLVLYLVAYISIIGLLLFMLLLNASFMTLLFDGIKKLKLMPYYYSLLMGAFITGGELFLFSFFHSKLL